MEARGQKSDVIGFNRQLPFMCSEWNPPHSNNIPSFQLAVNVLDSHLHLEPILFDIEEGQSPMIPDSRHSPSQGLVGFLDALVVEGLE